MATSNDDVVSLYEGRFVRMVKRGSWEFMQRKNIKGIVGIVAVTPENKLLLIEHVSPPFNRTSVELPAGLAGDTPGFENETLEKATERELLEETGYEAADYVFLGVGATSAGLCNEEVHLYRARGVKKVAAGGGVDNENITVHEIPLADARTWLLGRLKEGAVVDMKIWAALYFAGLPEA